jgi:predicted nucleic acid-binding Zn ribbon protein
MHGRLPFLARRHARDEARVAKHRRETITAAVVRILVKGEPTKFAFEGACRHGLRSQLCLDGHAWAAADKAAATIVGEALRRIGPRRPLWHEGQPEHTQFGFAPVERFYCIRCGNPLRDPKPHGSALIYCSPTCRDAQKTDRRRKMMKAMSAAEYQAMLVMRREAQREASLEERTKVCPNCGKAFVPLNARTKFCSESCSGSMVRYEIKCAWCRKTAATVRANARFCSRMCADRHYHAKQRANGFRGCTGGA